MSNPSESARKQAAVSFLSMIVEGKIHEAYARFAAPEMRHHNPYFHGDAASLERAMAEDHAQHPRKTLDIRLALAEGELVALYAHVHMQPGDRGYGIVHFYRFADDRIIELWDIAQPVPENSPNEQGMF